MEESVRQSFNNNVRVLEPQLTAEAEGIATGQRMMRDRIAVELAQFASSHPDPVVSDELWTFVDHVRRITP